MGGEGSILAMIISLKNNARPKRKAFKSWDKYKDNIYQEHKSLEFKKVSEEELIKIRTRFKKQRMRENRIQIMVTLVILLPIVFLLTKLSIKKVEENKVIKQQQVITKQKKERIQKENMLFYLNDGYKWLNQEHYKNAKYQFYKAYEIGGYNYNVELATARAYVYDCIKNNYQCSTTDKLIERLRNEHADSTEVKELIELYDSNN
jgi:hypothetical protein